MSQWSMQKVAGSPAKRVSVALLLATLAGGLGGCETDSWFNPAQVGRMENTPTIVPVLDRINSVEGGDAANPNSYSQVTAEDLQVEPESYRMGPGDGIVVKVQDFFEIGKEEMFERVIDDRGFVELPRVGPIFIAGQTGDEAGQTVSRALKTRRILMDPTVDVNAVQRRRQTYSILGGVLNPGTYTIPRPDFRLLEALSNSGRFSENVQWVYVIRTVSLGPTPTGAKGTAAAAGTPAANPAAQPGTGAPPKKDSVIDLIDSLGGPEPTPANPPSQPPAQPPAKPTGNPGDMGLVSAQPGAAPARAPQLAEGQAPTPAIDIDVATRQPGAQPAQPAAQAGAPTSEWQFVAGQWVKGSGGKPVSGNPASGVLTQRVLQIPLGALMNGSEQYNVVVRPGDVIRVQSLNEGIVYVHGNINRPGVYNLPSTGRMTIIRAIAAASDLSDTGIPERVDVTRYIGPDRQATVRVNYRAIVEGTQPDLVLRDGDVVNVGTNFWAFPIAVLRNGFRGNYGFSMTLDRNFGYDVFGPQRTFSPTF